jgi:hypothetical protein
MRKIFHANPIYTVLLVAYIFIHISSNTLWGNKNYEGIIETDGVGYYSYLPAVFIYQDLSFDFLDQASDHFAKEAKEQIQVHSGHGIANKYFVGSAFLQLPFFFIAHAITLLEGGIADGYSKWYQILMSLAGIFYAALGLYLMSKIFVCYEIPRIYTHLLLLTLAFGTSLMVYAVFEPCMSHVYSFYLINHAIYLFKRQEQEFSAQRNLWLALLVGIIILVRPINVVFLLSLFWLFGTKQNLLNYLSNSFNQRSALIGAVLITCLVVSIQPCLYYLSTGNFFLYSYSDEGFNWTSPEIINYLMSFRKGLFVYTPVTLIGFIAGCYIYRKQKYLLLTWLLFATLLIYVLSSWWCWWYGGSFGQRSMIEFYFIFFITLALLLKKIQGLSRTFLVSLLLACIVVCQIQIYQYRYYYIHYSDMNWTKYKKVFLRLDYILKDITADDVYKK